MELVQYIIGQSNLAQKGVNNTINLLNDGATVPFISRYRKEMTGNLDEVQIGQIVSLKEQYDTIISRKETIIKAMTEQNVLTAELQDKIDKTMDLVELEDIYLPYKKKRRTKAQAAKENGLEPLAKTIMEQRESNIDALLPKYLNDNISTKEEALEGAKHIIAEWINEDADIRNIVRKQLEKFATIKTKVSVLKKEDKEAQKYRDYFEWEEPLKKCPSHRLLAILRAETEGIIRVKVEIDNDIALDRIYSKLVKREGQCADIIEDAMEDSFKRLLYPSLSNERLRTAKELADDNAITVFSKNLKQLLLGSPLGEKRILAIDPGFRTGCKVVCLSEQGDLLHNTTIYPHPPQNNLAEAQYKISSLVGKYNIEAIAIGDGTASRETEAMIRNTNGIEGVEVFVISEAGASIYSASKIAREEFPDQDVTVRGAVSIGRRLGDPLAELVKIDPKSIGVGQYQHDVDQHKLKTSLDTVVEHCVNLIGVNINTASVPLLSYVSGLGEKLAENIVTYRQENGGFKSRSEIKKVPRLGDKAFEQCAAFLRIKNAKNPLDDSAVHPESYAVVKNILKNEGKTLEDLLGNKQALAQINLNKYVDDKTGLPTLKDIVKELEKPGVDIREKAKAFSFDPNIKTIEDVKAGMTIPGIVNNITNFGCFVNIGVKESGLVHVSNLSDSFVKDVNDHVALHQQVTVEVLNVDLDRKRIQLKLIK